LQASQHTESFRTGETLALPYGDIGPGNVLWGREPALIDWEYTRLGDPADEIAYLFDQNALAGPAKTWSFTTNPVLASMAVRRRGAGLAG
jgi:aminoglycoside phosphotransferase (APT) family kinase protein